MASPTTTHVIEIEAGIGEPAFIPLSLGQELQPISVGKKGMWRLESPRVLDVHAFVYFDGTSLFVQSADEANAASVDGFAIGKSWTELHAPCTIEVGQARLRFRSLIADADNQPTEVASAAPVKAPPGGPGTPSSPPRPGASMPVAVPATPPSRRAPAPAREETSPVSFPKPERPFKPGELASVADDESTRIAPLDNTSGARRPGSSGDLAPYVNSGMMQMQGPMAAPPPPHGFGPPQGYDGNGQPLSFAPPPSSPHGPHGPHAFDPNAPHYLNGGASGPYPAMPAMGPNGMLMNGMMVPSGYGSMTPQGGQPVPPPASSTDDFLTRLKAQSIPKMVAGLIFIVGGIWYLAHDDDPAPRPVARMDAGVAATSVAAATTVPPVAGSLPVAPPVWPAGVPCPPPNWPAGTPLPCTPNPATPAPGKEASVSATAAGAKTLERQAVDLVAAGDTSKAAAAYEELMRREPNNKVYAEAARILRAKLDAGASPP